MKFLIASDIHGSFFFAKKVVEMMEKEKADTLILLGDIYNHGPRNPFPTEYNPGEVAILLNSIKDKLIVVKGNCDSEVDEMISEFKFEDHILTQINGKNVYFTHGHKYNIEVIPYEEFDILIYGHIHQGFIEEKEGYLFANPGSISLPKGGTKHSYLVFDENALILKDVDGEIIQKYNF